MELRSVQPESNGERAALAALHAGLAQVEALLNEFSTYVQAEHAGVAAGRALLEKLGLREVLISHMEANFPQQINDMRAAAKENEPPAPNAKSSKPTSAAGGASDGAKKPRKARAPVPEIPYVRVTEFNEVPAYMKGRMARETLNKSIDVLNKAVAEKYKILRTPRAKLGDMAMNMYVQFKELELDELEGKFFFVDADIKQLAAGRIDRNAMTILRHLHRIVEHRSKGCVRYIIQPAIIN